MRGKGSGISGSCLPRACGPGLTNTSAYLSVISAWLVRPRYFCMREAGVPTAKVRERRGEPASRLPIWFCSLSSASRTARRRIFMTAAGHIMLLNLLRISDVYPHSKYFSQRPAIRPRSRLLLCRSGLHPRLPGCPLLRGLAYFSNTSRSGKSSGRTIVYLWGRKPRELFLSSEFMFDLHWSKNVAKAPGGWL